MTISALNGLDRVLFAFIVGVVLHCRTISDVSHLPDLEYQSNTIAIHSQSPKLSVLPDDLSTVFEGQGSVDRMFDIHNGTVELRFLELCSENLETLRLSEQSECVMAAGKIHVLEDRTPLRCDDSRLIVDSCEFVFKSEVSPSLFTTRSTSGEVYLRNCEMGDRLAATSGSFVSSSCVQDLKIEKCRFQNISHCPTYSRSDLATPFFNVSVVDSVFARSENVFSGGVVRDVNDKTTLLSLNSSYTHSLSTFTDFLDFKYIQHATIEVTTNHRYIRCLFQQCTTSNVYGGAIRCDSGASLEIVSCRFDQNTAIASSGDLAYIGGGIYFKGDRLTSEFYMAHTLHTKDHANIGGSAAILESGNSRCWQGNVVFSTVAADVTICFFSCLFFNNEALDVQPTTVDGQPVTASVGNDIRFDTNKEWKAILANDSSFINSFSDSRFPRISIGYGPHIVDFSYLAPSSYTVLDVRLPDPAVLVDISKGSNGPVCGTSYSGRCATIGYAGTERLEKDDVQVVVEAGRYDETQAFSISAKAVKVSSFGDFHPIVLFSPPNSEDAFMTNEAGSLSLSFFVFVPSRSASVVKQSGGSLSIASCVFRGEEGVEAIVSNVVEVRGGSAKLENVEFSSFTLSGGHCITCLDTTSKLEMVSCSLLWVTGDSDSAIQFARTSLNRLAVQLGRHNNRTHPPSSIDCGGWSEWEGRVAVLGVGELVWISDLGARLLAEYEWSILMKTGTTSEGTLQLTGKTIKIAGEGKDLSILESTQRSSLLSMSSGTVSFEDVGFTQHSSLSSTDQAESLFIIRSSTCD
ncbi:hypothetical protein BLNAU_24457 [Blattamonas nauphoetae]|uniref:Uncharacterized protein n=1 Tax=Blattamonas nauphoetae TaxID=2049346 RepID=A0ABQ9WMD1_9EUKA|nr:hypothetical protein BLNAU_24457 [Blattamonas nauphoetae]